MSCRGPQGCAPRRRCSSQNERKAADSVARKPGWARLGSNQRPLACEASALPLSYAPGSGAESSRARTSRSGEDRRPGIGSDGCTPAARSGRQKNDVWISKTNGKAQKRFTKDGTRGRPYYSPSIADNGTIVALRGIQLHSFRPNGRRIIKPRLHDGTIQIVAPAIRRRRRSRSPRSARAAGWTAAPDPPWSRDGKTLYWHEVGRGIWWGCEPRRSRSPGRPM